MQKNRNHVECTFVSNLKHLAGGKKKERIILCNTNSQTGLHEGKKMNWHLEIRKYRDKHNSR